MFRLLLALTCLGASLALAAENPPATPVPAPAPAPSAAAPAAQVRVILKDAGFYRAKTVKVLRDFTGLDLNECNQLASNVPATIKETDAAEAEKLRQALVDAGATVVVNTLNGQPAPVQAPGKATRRVILKAIGPSKILAVKVTRDVTGLGLAESKRLVESTPSTIKETDEADAERIHKAFSAIGATTEVTPIK